MMKQILSWLLRLPGVFILEFVYHINSSEHFRIQCIGYLIAIPLITLRGIHHLKSFYIHIIIFILLMVSSTLLSFDYITSSQDSDSQHIYKDAASMQRMIVYIMKQGVLVVICVLLSHILHGPNRYWICTAFIPTIIVPTFGLEPMIAQKTLVVLWWFKMGVIVSYLACRIRSLLDLAGHGLTWLKRMLIQSFFLLSLQQEEIYYLIVIYYRQSYLPSMFGFLWVCLAIFYNYNIWKVSNVYTVHLYHLYYVATSPWSWIGLCCACISYFDILLYGRFNVNGKDSMLCEGLALILSGFPEIDYLHALPFIWHQ